MGKVHFYRDLSFNLSFINIGSPTSWYANAPDHGTTSSWYARFEQTQINALFNLKLPSFQNKGTTAMMMKSRSEVLAKIIIAPSRLAFLMTHTHRKCTFGLLCTNFTKDLFTHDFAGVFAGIHFRLMPSSRRFALQTH